MNAPRALLLARLRCAIQAKGRTFHLVSGVTKWVSK